MKIKEQTRKWAADCTWVPQGEADVVWIWFSKSIISFYSPTQLCGGGTTKSNSNELPISVPLSFYVENYDKIESLKEEEMYLVIGIVLAFILSFWKDNRSLWNPVLFLLSLTSSYFYLSYLFYKNGYENVQLAFYGFAFVLLPLLLFLSGIFLIYNGIILLKKEGRSKG